MTSCKTDEWEIAAGLAVTALAAGAAAWLILRKRPSADEVERRRRDFLVQSGRLVDGMLLDVYEVEAEDARTLTMLLFNYRIAGVDYECSQDITAMRGVVDVSQVTRRISLFSALSARQSPEQHRRRRGMDRAARGPSATTRIRRSRPSGYEALKPERLERRVGARYPSPVTL